MSNVPQARVILRDVVKQLKTGTITRMGAAKVVSAAIQLKGLLTNDFMS